MKFLAYRASTFNCLPCAFDNFFHIMWSFMYKNWAIWTSHTWCQLPVIMLDAFFLGWLFVLDFS
jgi:hypothetical protein